MASEGGGVSVEELMKWASACAESGDTEGEIDAYRKADELGDSEAAIFLGNALRKRGENDLARAAYERAEARGHREAAMSLGNLYWDEKQVGNAKAAFLRSEQLGSVLASLNLGLMLSEAGESEEALPHLQRAADAGDSGGFWGIGKVREQQGDFSASADAYRSGAALGDRSCAFGLGYALYMLGDPAASREAFTQAHELGDERAADMLQALDNDERGETPGTSVGQLWSNVTALYDALAAERQKLGRQWITSTLVVQQKQARLAALNKSEDEIGKQLSTVTGRFSIQTDTTSRYMFAERVTPPGPRPDQWLESQSGNDGPWTLVKAQARAFSTDLEEGRSALHQAEGKAFGGGLRRRGAEALGRVEKRLGALRAAVVQARREVAEAEASREQEGRAAVQASRDAFDPVASLAASSALELPPIMQPWSSSSWDSWTIEDERSLGLRLAYGGVLNPRRDDRLGSNAGFGTDVKIPWGLTLHDSWHLTHDDSGRATAHGFVRSMMLRQLLSAAPGEVKFCVFDPVGLGQSAGDLLDLAEYDADLVGGKVWTSAQDLDARLAELSSHIELVIQKYLRTTYETIDEFNDAAGEVAEPYRVLVLFDSPAGLSPESASRLKSIVENGPRCGVFTFITVDTSIQAPYGVSLDQLAGSMSRLNLQSGFSDNINGYQLETFFEPEVLPERSNIAKRVIDSIGRATIHRTEAAVTFEKVITMYGKVAARGLRPELGTAATRTKVAEPQSWWTDDSTRGLFAPIGQKGARDVAILGFDSSDHAGALLVGRPGSGKSTLLHAYIGGLTTLYGPDELDLYLIDFKEGVEFKAYAEERLPHAKVIAIESDREFGLSVLESLQAEIAQRAEILRGTGGGICQPG